MHKTLTSVVALAGLAAAGAVQAEDAVVAGDSQPMELSSAQMDRLTAGGDFCAFCTNVAVVSQWAAAVAVGGFFGDTEAEAENESEIEQEIN